jgi:hypothetical protein
MAHLKIICRALFEKSTIAGNFREIYSKFNTFDEIFKEFWDIFGPKWLQVFSLWFLLFD